MRPNTKILVVTAMLALPHTTPYALYDCTSGKTLREMAHEATAILIGTLGSTKDVGYDFGDGTISKAASVPTALGATYGDPVTRLRIKVHRVIKGPAATSVTAYLSLHLLNLGNCPDRPLLVGQDAVFLLVQRPSGYWVVGGRDGVIFTGEEGVPGIIMQFSEPEVVK